MHDHIVIAATIVILGGSYCCVNAAAAEAASADEEQGSNTTAWFQQQTLIPIFQWMVVNVEEYFGLDKDQAVLFVWTVSVLVFMTAVVVWIQRRNRNNKWGSGMPILTGWTVQRRSYPFIGHGLTFLRHPPWDLITSWHKQTKHDLICFPLLGTTYFSVASPDLIKVILQSKIAYIHKDIEVTMKPFLSILGTGIVTSEGEHWLKQRLKMSHPLRFDILEIIPYQTLLAVQRLMKIMDEASRQTEPIPLGQCLRHLTLQVISSSFLSLNPHDSDEIFAKLYLPIVDECNQRVWHPYRKYMWIWPSFWKYSSNVKNLNDFVSSLITDRWQLRQKERKQQKQQAEKATSPSRRMDILDKVLQVYEKECGSDIPKYLSKTVVHQLRDEMKTFMLAGHETSAAMMTWALYELILDSDHGGLLQQLQKEADSVFDRNIDWKEATLHDLPPPEQLAKLVFSEATLKESLRKYSVVPIAARRVIQDLVIEKNEHHGQYVLPKGSSVMVNIQGVHSDPRYWPNPMKYDPHRFLDNKPEPFTFLPFIAGPRNCLGQHLALLESKMVLALLTQRYKLSIHRRQQQDTVPVNPQDWTDGRDPRHRFMVPVIPKEEVYVTVQRRHNK